MADRQPDADTPADTAPPPLLADPALLAGLRHDMLRFARLQLRDDALAEDAVQEAIEAARAGVHRFAGQAALKTWVFGILRHKIVDAMRHGKRWVALSAVIDEDGGTDEAVDALFRANGHWQPASRPGDWPAPDDALSSRQFWAVFEACLDKLPPNLARVFMMREMLGLSTGEICSQLDMTANNCHVILHRARTRLRACLEKNWFAAGETPPC